MDKYVCVGFDLTVRYFLKASETAPRKSFAVMPGLPGRCATVWKRIDNKHTNNVYVLVCVF
jgi:hypothetical protein